MSFWAIFWAFTTPTPYDLKNQIFEKKKKWKKIPGDIILSYIHVHHKQRSYDIWFLKYKKWRQKFLSFWAIFCPFHPLTTQKIKILTLKKIHGDITILHICTINDNHNVMYGSGTEIWSTTENYLSFWTVFCPFTPYGAENQNFDKSFWKYYHFTNVYHKWQSYMYGSWDMECNKQNFLHFYYPNILKYHNFQKMKKPTGDIIIFHRCTISDICFLRYQVQQTEFSVI